MTPGIEIIGLGIAFAWLGLLTVLFYLQTKHYNSLTHGATKGSLQTVLNRLLAEMDVAKKDIDFLKSSCDTIEKEGRFHIQKIGLLRFNPFKDTGGDQSFILSLLDGNQNGIIISGLYSRSGTRWYAKQIREGKGVEHELSDEEKKALKEAKQLK